jgi:hypothetical protein
VKSRAKIGRTAQASGKAYRFTSEAASKAGNAAAHSRQRMILTIICPVCGQKLTAHELEQHVC